MSKVNTVSPMDPRGKPEDDILAENGAGHCKQTKGRHRAGLLHFIYRAPSVALWATGRVSPA
jgi:hypothetical protein